MEKDGPRPEKCHRRSVWHGALSLGEMKFCCTLTGVAWYFQKKKKKKKKRGGVETVVLLHLTENYSSPTTYKEGSNRKKSEHLFLYGRRHRSLTLLRKNSRSYIQTPQ